MTLKKFCSRPVKREETGAQEPWSIHERSVPLYSVTKGSKLILSEIPPGQSRLQLIRLGLVTGQMIKCIERLPGGTVVIEKSLQEIAIGATLAKSILVTYASTD